MKPKGSSNLWILLEIWLCLAFWVSVAVLCIEGCSYESGTVEESRPLQVTFLDVGQGLLVLLEYDGHHALYDTGPDSAGVVDSLLSRGIDSLEWILVSHGHRDHAGGFMEMRAAVASGRLFVGRLLLGPDTAACLVNDSLRTLALQLRIPVDTLVRGDTVWLAEGIRFEVLWPVSYGRYGENRASVVMKVSLDGMPGAEDAGASVLLTGDLDSVGERRLLEQSPDLSAELMQVPHHGSAGSSTLKFLSRVMPRYAAIGVGRNNGYGHPSSEVLQKLKYVMGDSALVFRTDLHGSVSFELWPEIGIIKQ
ncbi:ComEC/Rec2 family competence protein [uncultured Fibrobacter sp.]|uniref:ComEC/Rec2 family competence protein n=1 Tax=uncultured Fibrobacter sp. TaxID=261512 RepID=UPI00260698BA|nr:ComEC/Rec2 family competence protein [uncultured Fibrobacter sp.]